MTTGHWPAFLGKKIEIRELTENDLPSLLELYIQLSENNKNITLEKSKEIWIKQMYNLKFSIQSFTFIKIDIFSLIS